MAEIIDKGSALKVVRDDNNVTYYDKLDSGGNKILFAKIQDGDFILSTPGPDDTVETFHFAENPEEDIPVTNPDCESFSDLLDKVIGFLSTSASTATGITPITSGNLDDFNPIGLESADTIIADNTGNNNITGLKAPDPVARVRKRFFVKGAGGIRFKDNDPSSAANNRFLTGGNVDVNADEAGIDLEYDIDVSRWRFIGKI